MKENIARLNGYEVAYTNKSEFKILKNEIFDKKIYSTQLHKDSPVIIDVGAHIGLSILFFKTQYPLSKIIAFEPNPNVYPLLEENIFFNKLANVTLHNVALGAQEEIRDLYIDRSGNDCFSTASFTKDAWSQNQPSIPIKVKTEKLSKYINKDVDILKIDVEGAETEILKDLYKTDKLKYIGLILIEFHPINGKSPKTLLRLLKENNFTTTVKEDSLGTDLIDILGKNISKHPA